MNWSQKDINQIKAYLRGGLPMEAAQAFEKRMAEDPDFARLVKEMKQFREGAVLSRKKAVLQRLQALESSLVEKDPPKIKGEVPFDAPPSENGVKKGAGRPGRNWRRPLGIAAGLFFIFTLGWLLWPDPPTFEEQLVDQHFEAFRFLSVERSGEATLANLKQEAKASYSQGDYRRAIPLLEDLYQNHQDTFSLFYLGIAYLGNDQPAKALEAFEQYGGYLPSLEDAVRWYQALAYLQSGYPQEARILLEYLAANNSPDYADKAEEVLSQLNERQLGMLDPAFRSQGLLGYLHQPTIHPDFFEAERLQVAKDYPKAVAAYQQLWENPRKRSREEQVYLSNQLAYNHLQMGQTAAAEPYLATSEALLAELNIPASALQADFFLTKGLFLKKKDEGKEAQSYFLKALPLYESVYGQAHLKYIETSVETGFGYLEYSRKIDSAYYHLESAFEKMRYHAALEPFSLKTFFGRATTCLFRRDYITGLTYVDKALSLAYQAPYMDTVLTARCHSLRGNMLKKKERFEAATLEFKRAIELGEQMTEVHPRVQEFYRDLMINYRSVGDSINFYRYLSEFKRRFPPSTYRYAFPDRLEGKFYIRQKKYRKSINSYQKFLADHLNRENPNRLLIDEAFYNLTDAYRAIGKYDSAMIYAIRNMTYETKYRGQDINWDTLVNSPLIINRTNNFVAYSRLAIILTQFYESEPQKTDLLYKALQLYTLIDDSLFNNMGVSEEDAVLQFLKEVGTTVYPEGVKTAYYLYQKTNDRQYLNWAHLFMERIKSTILYKDLLANASTNYPEVPGSLIQKELRLKKAINQRKLSLHTNLGSAGYRRDYEEMDRLLEELDALYKLFEEKHPRYYEDRIHQKIQPLDTIQQLLTRPDHLLVQYLFGREEIYLLLIKKTEVQLLKLAKPKGFDNELDRFRTILSDVGNEQQHQYPKLAHSLYQTLIAPVADAIPEKAKLTIIPDGPLGTIPFGALLVEEWPPTKQVDYRNLPYLIRKVEINYAHSIKTYRHNLKTGKKLPANPTILGFAFSDRSDRNNYLLPELPGTYKELEIIRKTFPEADKNFVYGAQSTKEYFIEQCKQTIDILHLGMHASSDNRNKLNNKIFFKSKDREGGKLDTLYGYEILPLQIKASLVVLSACETAYGATVAGEGTYSLTRSFVQTGIPHVIATLWRVEDDLTAEIIPRFYQALKKKRIDIYGALRQAKLKYIKNTPSHLLAHPTYWSGVVAY